MKLIDAVDKLIKLKDINARIRNIYGEREKEMNYLRVCVLPTTLINKQTERIKSTRESYNPGYYTSYEIGIHRRGSISYKDILGEWDIYYRTIGANNMLYTRLKDIISTPNYKDIWNE